MPDLKALKKKLRDHVHANLRAGAGQQSPDAAQKIRDHFLNHFPDLDPKLVVAGTSSIKDELDPTILMQALEKRGHRLCLPITNERATPLVFRAYKTGDTLVPHVWNIGVPSETQPILEPDILLCPLLAFDRTGARLGYGGGYYDATLQSLRAKKTIIAVGLAYAVQEVDAVPLGKYDQRMDLIITEKEVIVPNKQVPNRQR